MSRNIRYIFVILTAVFVIFIVLISRFYLKVDTLLKKDGYETNMSGSQDIMLTVFSDDNGLKGMKTSNNAIVIEAKWESIRQISGNKFIVSVKDNNDIRYGVIDISETVVIPAIYAGIEYDDMDRYFVGKTENNCYVLMNDDGSAIIEKEWTSYLKKKPSERLFSVGNYIQVQSGDDVYRICDLNDRMTLYYIKLFRKICGYNRQIVINNINHSINIKEIPGYYNQVTDNAINYINALFSSDAMLMRKISFEDSFKEIQLDELGIRGGELRYVDSIWPFVEEENGVITFSCNISLMYTVPGTIQWDGSYTHIYNAAVFHIRMKKDQDGILKINEVRVENIDLSKLNIPEECFDADKQDEGQDDGTDITYNVTSDVNDDKQDVMTD